MNEPLPSASGAESESDYLVRHRRAIEAAAAMIRPHVRRTPALVVDLEGEVVLKPECFQVTGSFKPRGAFSAVLSLAGRSPGTRGVIAVSSGNHAQAVALAARSVGLAAVVLIPHDANPAKVEATRRLGADVIQDGITFDNREERMRAVMAARGLAPIHPFDDWDVIHGAATAALELLEDHPDVGRIVTPVGGGGLVSGTALIAKALNPAIEVIGVEPELADDAARTLRAGTIQRLAAPPDTIADGVRVVSIGSRNFEVMAERGLVDAVVTVSEAQIEAAVAAAWTRLKLALEPTGALTIAAHLSGALSRRRDGASASRQTDRETGREGGGNPEREAERETEREAGPNTHPNAHPKHRPMTALVLSGGNFNPELIARILNHGGR